MSDKTSNETQLGQTSAGNHETAAVNHIRDELESITINKKSGIQRKYVVFGIIIASCLVLAVAGIIVGFKFNLNEEPDSYKKTADLVNSIMEDPMHCLLDDNCTSFEFNDTEIARIKQKFNEYDGDDDELWSKEEFITYYIESADGESEFNAFYYMDFNDDGIWSYKEAVMYYMMLRETPMIRDVAYPVFQKAVSKIYGYNTTIYDDQLFWEYAVEVMFVELDDYQQGFITKDDYLRNLAELEFDMYATRDENHETITFDEFFSIYNQESLDTFVNTNISSMTAEYHKLGIVLNHIHTSELLAEFKLQHCVYSTIEFESVRRRLAGNSSWDCLLAVAGCIGTAASSVAACVFATGATMYTGGMAIALIWAACGGGTLVTGSVCYFAMKTCEDWWDS